MTFNLFNQDFPCNIELIIYFQISKIFLNYFLGLDHNIKSNMTHHFPRNVSCQNYKLGLDNVFVKVMNFSQVFIYLTPLEKPNIKKFFFLTTDTFLLYILIYFVIFLSQLML